ncbi:MAG: hypothetical protein ACKVWR_02535 [Acidimicrobiales bacterium]
MSASDTIQFMGVVLVLVVLLVGFLQLALQRVAAERLKQEAHLRGEVQAAVTQLQAAVRDVQQATAISTETIARISRSLDVAGVYLETLGGVIADLLDPTTHGEITSDRFGVVHQRLLAELHRCSNELKLLDADGGRRGSAVRNLAQSSPSNRTRVMVQRAAAIHPDDPSLRRFAQELENEGLMATVV